MEKKLSLEDLHDNLLQLQRSIENSLDKPIFSHRKGVAAKIELFVKRSIRKCTRFLLKPFADDLHRLQHNLSNAVGLLVNQIDFVMQDIHILKSESISKSNAQAWFNESLINRDGEHMIK